MGCQSALYCVHGIFRHLQRRSENILHFFDLNIHQLNITTRSKVLNALVNSRHGLIYLACTCRTLQHHVKIGLHLFHSLFQEPQNVLKAL